MTYYRFTNKDTVMSDWGHAMFVADNEDIVSSYGCYEYLYNGASGVYIESLYPVIATVWDKCAECGTLPIGYDDIDAHDACKMFNPDDIVMSAGAWDDGDLLTWFCEYVAIPNDISAIITNDGAIVFDAALTTQLIDHAA